MVKNGTVEEAVRVTDPDTGIVKTKVVISHIVGQGAEAEKVRAIIFVGPDGMVTIATLGP